jgi:regulator of protease activity HflC (stomatin/prohibitin superfamily)
MTDFVVGIITIIGLCGFIFGVLFLMDYGKRRSEHTVAEFQRAVFFRNGHPQRDLGPGVHNVLLGRDYIIYGDVRPIVVNFENQQVGLRDGSFVRYSFFASTSVNTFQTALYSARDFSELPFYILRRNVREGISAESHEGLTSGRDVLEKRIEGRTRSDLNRVGFELTEFRLGQLSVSERPNRNSPQGVTPSDLLN